MSWAWLSRIRIARDKLNSTYQLSDCRSGTWIKVIKKIKLKRASVAQNIHLFIEKCYALFLSFITCTLVKYVNVYALWRCHANRYALNDNETCTYVLMVFHSCQGQGIIKKYIENRKINKMKLFNYQERWYSLISRLRPLLNK